MKNRGARKLELALEGKPGEISKIKGAVCIDLGASHGGFARTLLDHGASRVYCVDVAYGILDYTLRIDPRIRPLERKNARNIDVSWFPDLLEGNPEKKVYVTSDLSFISLKTILTSLATFLKASKLNQADGMLLVKPQFEDSKATTNGILRDETRREEILSEVSEVARGLGFKVSDRFDLPEVSGKNREIFLLVSWTRAV